MRRVLIISHAYLSSANRGKLRALASRGVDVTVGVPQRWRDVVLGGTTEIAWERQNGVEVFPIPARRHGEADAVKFGGRALHALLRDKRPDLVQVEEESTTPAAQQVVRAARHLGLPAVLFTHQNVELPLPWFARRRRRRMLRRLTGAIAGSGAAAALLRRGGGGPRPAPRPRSTTAKPPPPQTPHGTRYLHTTTTRPRQARFAPSHALRG